MSLAARYKVVALPILVQQSAPWLNRAVSRLDIVSQFSSCSAVAIGGGRKLADMTRPVRGAFARTKKTFLQRDLRSRRT